MINACFPVCIRQDCTRETGPFLPAMKYMYLIAVFAGWAGACQPIPADRNSNPPRPDTPVAFSLDELQRRTFLYFWEQADSGNWQIPDRYPTRRFSSIAATGFGLTAYLVGVERGYITRQMAAERVHNTLQVLINLPQGPDESGISGHKGLFYHFLTYENAHRYQQVELSTIDTGLLMAGILSTQSYFDGDGATEQRIRQWADTLYRRVEWDWAMKDNGFMSMGWKPESGFLSAQWDGYNEAMILLVLALGSPTHAIPAESWDHWTSTYEWTTFQGYEHLNFSPLFGPQYSHMYIDFRGINDAYMREKGIDYAENSRRATYPNRAYCIENPLGFPHYAENVWGLTACDGPNDTLAILRRREIVFHSYWARGASALHVRDDGTLAPTAAGGSVPFAPEICIPALKQMWDQYHDELVDEYGFKDAFNPAYTFGNVGEKGWFDIDYLGIDQGPILIQIENHRSALVWDLMKKNPYIRAGLEKAGFTGGWLEGKNK